MSTQVSIMQEIADKKLDAYKSDLIHDGIVIGENKDCSEFLWMVRSTGTDIVPLKPYLSRHGKTTGDLHPLLDYYKSGNQHGIDVYHLKNPLKDTNDPNNPGSLELIDFEQAEKLYWQAQEQKAPHKADQGKDADHQGPQKMKDCIYEIDIYSAGDPSVGIHDYDVRLQDSAGAILMDYGVVGEDEKEELVDNFREAVKSAFEIALGDESPVDVRFDCDPPEMGIDDGPGMRG